MARKRNPDSAPAEETLEGIETIFDRIADGISARPSIFLGAVIGILAIVGSVGVFLHQKKEKEEEASIQVAAIQRNYFRDSGSAPGTFRESVAADPKVHRNVQEEYLPKFQQVAEDYPRTTAGVQALLEAATISVELEGIPQGIELLREAKTASSNASLRALVSMRLAGLLEASGELKAAAAEFELASLEKAFPARFEALGEAARISAEAGDDQRAVAFFLRLESESPDFQLLPHVRHRLSLLVKKAQ